HVTQTRRYRDAVNYTATDRVYDWRGRVVQTRGPDDLAMKSTLDNLGRPTVVETYHDGDSDFAIDTGELRAKSATFYDQRGQAFKQVAYEVDTGAATGHTLTTLTWF